MTSAPLKLVLDTNVALDWILFEDPAVTALRDAMALGTVTIFTNVSAVEELRDVLRRERFALSEARQGELADRYLSRALMVAGADERATARGAPERGASNPAAATQSLPRCRDPDDDVFLALALRCQADLLVSRDKEVLALTGRCAPFGFRIVSVRQAMEEISRLTPP